MKLNKFFRTLFCVIILIASSHILFAQSEDSKKLMALQRRHFEAMIHKDTTLLSGLLADSLVYIHSSGVIDDKKSFMKDIVSGRIEYLFILPEKVTATVDGSYGWIYGRANIRFRLASMIGTIDQYVSFVEVYRMKKYQWQLVLCHNARIEPNAPYVNNYIPQVKGGSMPSIY
jgi:hypothetical protein